MRLDGGGEQKTSLFAFEHGRCLKFTIEIKILRNIGASEECPGPAEPQLRIDAENTQDAQDTDIKEASFKEAAKWQGNVQAELGLRGPRDTLSCPLRQPMAPFPCVQRRYCFLGREPASPWGRPGRISRSFVR